jgi:hypothetical protein
MTAPMPPDMRQAARELHDAGLSVVRVKEDGSKQPDRSWKQYQAQRSTPAEHDVWFDPNRRGGPAQGIGYVLGQVSGNVEMIEFEGCAIAEGYLERVTEIAGASGLSDVLKAVLNGWVDESPKGGLHAHVRVEGAPVKPNTKLASRPARDDELTPEQVLQRIKNPGKVFPVVLIETRGEGGFVVGAPSHGRVHPSGKPYKRVAGGPATIPTLNAHEYAAIHALMRAVDQMPVKDNPKSAPKAPRTPLRDGELRPGDDFENKVEFPEILTPHGWMFLFQHGPTCYWRRPGKDVGVSATTGRASDRDRFYVFSTSTEFTAETPYTKFATYTLLNHGGDYTAATRALAAQGYGQKAPQQRHLRAVPAPTDGANALSIQAEQVVSSEQPEVGYDLPKSFGLSAATQSPDKFQVRSSGVWYCAKMIKDEEGNEKPLWVRVAYAPLVVSRTFHDPENTQSIELSWMDRGKVVAHVVPRDVAKRGRELVKQLGGNGLPAIEADARLLERWLAEFEMKNRHHIPDEYLARYLGWQPDGSFVNSPEDAVKVEVVHDEQRGPAAAHRKAGSPKGWREAMAGLQRHSVPRIAVAAGFAAPLLRPLGVTSFTLDISSRSTKGKTTCAQCAMSIWADPSEQADAMSNWRTTLFAIEKRLNLVRGMLTVFDETMAVDDETLIDQVLYQLPMNHGKSRSGGYASMLPWETILLSTGERPALSFTTAQGAAARILGTTVPPFGDGGGEAAIAARDGVLANYGHAGPRFVELLLQLTEQPGGRDRLRERHRKLREELKGSNDMTARRSPMVAALVLAEALASEWKILPYAPLPLTTWRSMFAAQSPTDNRPEMAMDVVREYIAGHGWELWPSADERPPLRGWLGATKTKDGETRIAILPERLKTILSDSGYSLDAVEEGWIASNYLELRDSCRPKHKIPVRINGNQSRCYVFTGKALGIPDAAQGVQETL